MNITRGAASALFLFFLSTSIGSAQSLQVGPSGLTFTSTLGSAAPQTQSISVRHTGDTPRQFTLTSATLNGGLWLGVSALGGTTPARIAVTADPRGLQVGTYLGTIQIASQGLPTVRVDVSLNVTSTNVLQAAPAQLTFSRQAGFDALGTEQYVLVNTAGNPSSFSIATTVTDSGNWLSASATPTTTPGIIAVRATSTGLAAGTYTGNIAITAPGLTTVNVPVTLSVSAGPLISANPSAVTLTAVRGGSAASAQVNLQMTSAVTQFTASTPSSAGWLVVEPQISSAPGSIRISANPTGLGTGTYTSTVTVLSSSAANGTLTIPVTFNVTDGTVITASQTELSTQVLSSLTGNAALTQDLPLIAINSATAGATFTATASTANGGAWLTTGTPTGVTPGNVLSNVDATGLSPGTYRGQITVASSGNTIVIPVTLLVSAGGAQFVLDQSALTFNYQRGQSQPSSQIVNITSTGAALAYQTNTSAFTTVNNAPWLTGAINSGNTPGQITLGINATAAATLPNGQYTATVAVNSVPGTTPTVSAPSNVNITLNVADTPFVNVTPALQEFSFAPGGATQADGRVTVSSTDGATRAFNVTWSTTSGGNWLFVGSVAGTTPGNIDFRVFPLSGLAPGVYEGTIVVTVPSISALPLPPVKVRMRILPSMTLTATPNTLTFDQTQGGAAPASRTVNIAASTGTANYLVSAATFGGGSWLTVTPAGGTTPGAITISVNGTGLAPGSYFGSVGVTSGDAANNPLQIPVTLRVLAPALVLSPTSVTFSAAVGSSTQLSREIAVTSIVPFTATVSTPPAGIPQWLSVTPAAGTTSGTILIVANPIGLSAGTYVGTVTVTAATLSNSPQAIPVTLTVAAVAPAGRQIISQIADGSGWKTTITLVNLDTEPAPYTLNFFQGDGSVLRLAIDGTPGRLETISGVIPVGGSRTIETSGTDAALNQGWAELTSTKTIGGQGVFRQRVTGRPDQEAGVSATLPSARFILPYDNTQGFVSAMAIANVNTTSARAATVQPRLEDGTALNPDSVNLPARGHTAFAMADRFPSMAGRRGSVEFSTNNTDFAALGLRFNTSGSFTSLPALDVSATPQATEVTRVISQIADGAGWRTLITLVNLDTVPAPFTLRFFRQDGTAWTLTTIGSNPLDTIEGTIPVGGTRIIETIGNAAVVSQGWAQLTSARAINGLAVFRQSVTGRPDQEAAVSLTSTGQKFVLPFDNTGEFTTSMALVNAASTGSATITAVVRDEAGVQIGAVETISLAARGQTAFGLPARLTGTTGRRGTVEFTSSNAITGLGLRFTQVGAFTSFPVMPKR